LVERSAMFAGDPTSQSGAPALINFSASSARIDQVVQNRGSSLILL
jgi:hypothetical protein